VELERVTAGLLDEGMGRREMLETNSEVSLLVAPAVELVIRKKRIGKSTSTENKTRVDVEDEKCIGGGDHPHPLA